MTFIPFRTVACTLASALLLIGCQDSDSSSHPPHATQTKVSFDWFEYQGRDAIFEEPLPAGEFQNPIIAGFHPDPSIVRVGDDYYLAQSTFAWNPGVPVFHSRDLVNWNLIGHALGQGQVTLDERQVSEGIFAPTLRYHEGVFYLITTAVQAGGNFFVTATDPAGPWSDPIWLPEVGGIDPDIFFDDDGRIYIAHNDAPPGEPLYDGHRALWLWEYDPETQAVIPPARLLVDGGVDISQEPIWIEAPHIFKHNDWYYLTAAEGGTGANHSQVIFRSRSLDETFDAYSNNPILTQRDLPTDRANPITSAGHADFVQLPNGDWWAVFLATRPYDQHYYNTGRETFLLPVTWEDDWPVILPPQTAIPHRLARPQLPAWEQDIPPTTGNFLWRDEFTTDQPRLEWSILRDTHLTWYQQSDGQMHLTPQALTLSDRQQPAFLARRQAHMRFSASTQLQLPLANQVAAGIAAFQNESYHYFMGLTRQDNGYRLFLEKTYQGATQTLAQIALPGLDTPHLVFSVDGDQDAIQFFYQFPDGPRTALAAVEDARMLSTEVAGGFVGSFLGLHARQER